MERAQERQAQVLAAFQVPHISPLLFCCRTALSASNKGVCFERAESTPLLNEQEVLLDKTNMWVMSLVIHIILFVF